MMLPKHKDTDRGNFSARTIESERPSKRCKLEQQEESQGKRFPLCHMVSLSVREPPMRTWQHIHGCGYCMALLSRPRRLPLRGGSSPTQAKQVTLIKAAQWCDRKLSHLQEEGTDFIFLTFSSPACCSPPGKASHLTTNCLSAARVDRG